MLLAALLIRPNQVVSTDALIDALWGERPPPSAGGLLQVYVSQVRKVLSREARLVTRPPGYLIEVQSEELDSARFAQLLEQGREALGQGNHQLASATLAEALALWRGPALADFAFEHFAQSEAARLEELRLVALEARIQADLELGRHDELVPELRTLVAAEPRREHVRAQLMLALYRSGRQADALEVYREGRRVLVEELGIDPGAELQGLEQAILNQDPSLAARAPARSKLPSPPGPLIGRERELGEIDRLLRSDDVHLLTLTGAGGTGKTRLAIEAASRAPDLFPDGVFFAALAPVSDAAFALSAMAQALEVQETGAELLPEALRRHLAGRRLLLVADNLEHLPTAAPLLAELIATAPGVKVLATSRSPLHVSAEHVYDVPPLTGDESVGLLIERARRARRDFAVTDENAPELAAICSRLDGLPLAIELAAARLRLLTPAGLLARLERRLPLLTGGDRDLPARQQTLSGAIEWSYNLLRRADQHLFARLAIFAGGFTPDAVEAVCGLGDEPEPDTVDALTRLVDMGLVQAAPGADRRLTMLETIREYALELLARSGEEVALADRHVAYFLGLAELKEAELRENQASVLAQLDAEHENLRAAIARTLALGDGATALRLVASLWRFWWARGFLTEGRQWLEQALSSTAAETDAARARALEGAATLAWGRGDSKPAREFAETAIAIYGELGDRRGVARGLNNLGLAAQAAGDYRHAESYFEQSGALAAEVGNERGVGVSLVNLGGLALIEGDYEAARRLSEEALSVHTRAQGEDGVAISQLNLGFAALEQGRYPAALEHLERALDLFDELGFREYAAFCLEGLAALESLSEKPARAAQLLGAAAAACEETGASFGPYERRLHERTVSAVRARLGEQGVAAAWAAGRVRGPAEE